MQNRTKGAPPEPPAIKIDAHFRLRRTAARLASSPRWTEVQHVEVGDLQFPLPDDRTQLTGAIASLYEDLGQGSARWKQLLDLCFLLQRSDLADIEAVLNTARDGSPSAERPTSANVLSVVLDSLELHQDLPGVSELVQRTLAEFEPVHRNRSGALQLLAAQHKSPHAMHWFLELYGGNRALYLLDFWRQGFPHNLDRGTLKRGAAAMLAWFKTH